MTPPIRGGQGRTDDELTQQADGILAAAKVVGWSTIAISLLQAAAVLGGVL